jgi:hypothetical protein
VAGIRGTTLIINLPGSSKGALECFEAVAGQIPHAIDLLQNSADCAEIQSKMNGLAFSPSPELKSPPVKIKQTGHVCPHKKKKSVNFKVFEDLLANFHDF